MDAEAVEHTDVAVIGAGPIGIELAVGLKRAGVEYLHFDAKQIGYTISWFAPQTRFFSSNERIAIAGVPLQTPDQGKCTREQYLAYLRSVVEEFDLRVNTYEPVVGIERGRGGRGDAGDFVLTTRPSGGAAGPRRYAARRLVLVTGGTDHPRKLNVPGEDGPHVSHYFDDPHRYFRRRLLIVGGKNSAVEAALRCHNAGAHVAISYRRAELPSKSIKYWLLPEINGLIESGRIAGYLGTVPTAIHPTHVTLDRAHRAGGGGDGEGRSPPRGRMPPALPVDAPADFVLALIGYEQDNTLLK